MNTNPAFETHPISQNTGAGGIPLAAWAREAVAPFIVLAIPVVLFVLTLMPPPEDGPRMAQGPESAPAGVERLAVQDEALAPRHRAGLVPATPLTHE